MISAEIARPWTFAPVVHSSANRTTTWPLVLDEKPLRTAEECVDVTREAKERLREMVDGTMVLEKQEMVFTETRITWAPTPEAGVPEDESEAASTTTLGRPKVEAEETVKQSPVMTVRRSRPHPRS